MSVPDIRIVVWGDHPSHAVTAVLCSAVLGGFVLGVTIGQQPQYISWQPDHASHLFPHLILITVTGAAVWRNWGLVPAYSLTLVPVYAIELYNCCLVSRFHPIGVFPAPPGDFAMNVLVTAGLFWIGGVVAGSVFRLVEAGFRTALD